MKDYIDLTQLPAEKVEAMVLALSKNDFDLLRKYCDELGILYGYPMEEVVNIFSDQLLLSKKTLTKAVGQMDPEFLASQVDIINETLSSKADLSALTPIQNTVSDISNNNTELNSQVTTLSTELSVLEESIDELSTKHDTLSNTVNNISTIVTAHNDKLDTIEKYAEKNVIEKIKLNGIVQQPTIDRTINLAGIALVDTVDTDIKNLSTALTTRINNIISESTEITAELKNDIAKKLDVDDKIELLNSISTVSAEIGKSVLSNARDISTLNTNVSTLSTKLDVINNDTKSNTEKIVLINNNLNTLSTDHSTKISTLRNEINSISGYIDGRVDAINGILNTKANKSELTSITEDIDNLTEAINQINKTNEEQDDILDNAITAVYLNGSGIAIKEHELSLNVVSHTDLSSAISAQVLFLNALHDSLCGRMEGLENQLSNKADLSLAQYTRDTFEKVFKGLRDESDARKSDISDIKLTHLSDVDALKHTDDLLSTEYNALFHHAADDIRILSEKLAAEVEVQNKLNKQLSDDIRRESETRLNADSELKANLNLSVNVLGDAISKEIDNRKNDIRSLSAVISSEISSAISGNIDKISDHEQRIVSAETDIKGINNNIINIEKTFTKNIQTLKDNLEEESIARKDSDRDLYERVNKCEIIVGENKDAYKAHSDSINNLIAATSTNSEAVATLKNDVAELSYTIKNSDGILTKIGKLETANISTTESIESIQTNINDLSTTLNGTGIGGDGLADRIGNAEKEITGLKTDLKDINSISDTLYGNPDDSTDNGLTAVVNNLIFAIGADSIGSQDSISKRLDDINNNLSGNRADNPNIFGVYDRIEVIETTLSGDSVNKGIWERLNIIADNLSGNHDDTLSIFGVYDRIEDLESDIPELSATVVNLQLSATATVEKTTAVSEKITSVSKDLDDTVSRINDLSETTKKVNEAIYGDGNPLNGLDNIVKDLSNSINDINGDIADHAERLDALEKNTVDFSPINARLDEVDSSLSALSAENAELLAAVTEAQNNIIELNDNFEVRVSDMFVDAIDKLASDEDYQSVVDKDEYAAAIKLIDLDGPATITDVVNRLNAIITVINNVANS